jgi:hypothetical protein
MSETKHPGSCHCGKVRFEVTVDAAEAISCNCSVCHKLGTKNGIVGPEAVKVIAGDAHLQRYAWGKATRSFCKECGVTCFTQGHVEAFGGDYFSVPLNVLDDVDVGEVKVTHWDGRHDNWEGGPSDAAWPVFRDGQARPATWPVRS